MAGAWERVLWRTALVDRGGVQGAGRADRAEESSEDAERETNHVMPRWACGGR